MPCSEGSSRQMSASGGGGNQVIQHQGGSLPGRRRVWTGVCPDAESAAVGVGNFAVGRLELPGSSSQTCTRVQQLSYAKARRCGEQRGRRERASSSPFRSTPGERESQPAFRSRMEREALKARQNGMESTQGPEDRTSVRPMTHVAYPASDELLTVGYYLPLPWGGWCHAGHVGGDVPTGHRGPCSEPSSSHPKSSGQRAARSIHQPLSFEVGPGPAAGPAEKSRASASPRASLQKLGTSSDSVTPTRLAKA